MSTRKALEEAFKEADTVDTDEAIEEVETEEAEASVDEVEEDTTEEATEEATEDTPEEAEGDEEATEEEAVADDAEEEVEEPTEEIAAPSSWRKDAAEKFSELPEDVRDYIHLREDQMHRGLEMYKADAQEGKKLAKAFEPYDEYLQQIGADRGMAVDKLLSAEMSLRTGSEEQKLASFQKLAYDYGVDLGKVSELQPIDPRIAQLETRLSQLQSQSAGTVEQPDAITYEELAEFAATHKYFDEVRSKMAVLLEARQAIDLPDAYDKACRLDDSVFGKIQEATRQEAQAEITQKQKKAASKAKSAAVSVKGSPAGRTTSTPKSTRDAIEQAWDETGLN